MKNYIKLMRPYQYVKNLFIFAPAFFAIQILEPFVFLCSLGVFIGFSLVCSSVYIMNDIIDVQADRAHKLKALRPIASGAISYSNAICFGCALFIAGLLIIANSLHLSQNILGGGGQT